jgi:hypothetical protein
MARAPRTRSIAICGAMSAAMLMAAPVWADVTLTQNTGGKMFTSDMSGTNTTRIKGHKMRVDMKTTAGPGGGQDTSMIFDVDAGKIIIINHKNKEATVRNTNEFGEALTKVSDADMKADLTATGATKTIAGASCTVYDSSVAVSFTPMEKQPPIKVTMAGPVCLSKNAPGASDFHEFYNAASQKGFIFSDPAQAKAQPGIAKGMATMMKKWSDAGVALSSDVNMNFEGQGMMAEMMKKMGGGKMTSEATKIETGAIGDDVFTVPVGYKTKTN